MGSAGMKRIAGITYVLDGFHLEKYLTRLTSHMKDSQWDIKNELRDIIRNKSRREFEEFSDMIAEYLENEAGLSRIREARAYILSNWKAARLRLNHAEGVKGSSTEGHVSHVLSNRMSSRPMGWSKKGADKMSQLRAYHLNGGDMLELVRYQKKELSVAVGTEYKVLRSIEILWSEKSRHGEVGKYTEAISHSLTFQNKKRICFNSHIWGL